jgi:hypothetical protein
MTLAIRPLTRGPAGMHDRFAGGATSLLHGQAAYPSTVDEPARRRLQLAAHALGTGSKPLAAIAADVGHEPERAFNRAFRRAPGIAPAEWRRRRVEVVKTAGGEPEAA